jgi:hypothetical protein
VYGCNIEDLLRKTPIIIPSEMHDPTTRRQDKKVKYGYDTTFFTDKTSTDEGTGNFTLIYLLTIGNIVTMTHEKSSGTTKYKTCNLYTLSKDEKDNLVNLYMRGLRECDMMLTLHYLSTFPNPEQRKANVIAIENALKRSFETLFQTLKIDGVSLIQFSEEAVNLQWSTIRGIGTLIAKRTEHIDLFGYGDLYVQTPVDYDALDIESNSFCLFNNKTDKYVNRESLLVSITKDTITPIIQQYRLGYLVMDEEYTESILEFIYTSPKKKFDEVSWKDLIVIGGVLQRDSCKAHLRNIFKVIDLLDPRDPNYKDRIERYTQVIMFLSSSSTVKHCMIDINIRKAEHQVFGPIADHLDACLEKAEEAEEAGKSQDDIDAAFDIYNNFRSFAFQLADRIMKTQELRLHEDTVSKFDNFRYHISIEGPLKDNTFLRIYSQRHMLATRKFVMSKSGYKKLELSEINGPDRIVVIPADQATIQYAFSIYICYVDGRVVRPAKKVVQTQDNFSSRIQRILSVLDKASIDSVVEDRSTGGIPSEFQRVVSRQDLDKLVLDYTPPRNADMYISNLDRHVLVVFQGLLSEKDTPCSEDNGPVLSYRSFDKKRKIYLYRHSSVEKMSDANTQRLKNLIISYKHKIDNPISPTYGSLNVSGSNWAINEVRSEYGGRADILKYLVKHKDGVDIAGDILLKNFVRIIDFLKPRNCVEKFESFLSNPSRYKGKDKDVLETIKELFGDDIRSVLNIFKKKNTNEFMPIERVNSILALYKTRVANSGQSNPDAYKEFVATIPDKVPILMRYLDTLHTDGRLEQDTIDDTIANLNKEKEPISFIDQNDMKSLITARMFFIDQELSPDQRSSSESDFVKRLAQAVEIPYMKDSTGIAMIKKLLNRAKVIASSLNSESDNFNRRDKLNDSRYSELLSVQRSISNLIVFNIMFEKAIMSFIGRQCMGPIEEEFGDRAKNDDLIARKLADYRSVKDLEPSDIMALYGVRQKDPQVIIHEFDYSKIYTIVPPVHLIDPSFFESDETMSMLSQGGTPQFINVGLTNEELIIMAHLECKAIANKTLEYYIEETKTADEYPLDTRGISNMLNRRGSTTRLVAKVVRFKDEFDKIVAVLYHLKDEMMESANPIKVTCIRSLLSVMISDISRMVASVRQ